MTSKAAVKIVESAEYSRRFRGTIDDVQIYNRALPAEKILELGSRSYLAGDR